MAPNRTINPPTSAPASASASAPATALKKRGRGRPPKTKRAVAEGAVGARAAANGTGTGISKITRQSISASDSASASASASGRKTRRGRSLATATGNAPPVPARGKSSRKNRTALEKGKGVGESMTDSHDGPAYWLVKSEPESRIHKGQDVKFSLDDLEASSGPVAWDARNNLRAMVKGDQVFFYHSNCKVPGIVGVAEVVREHSVDDSAHDPNSAYYDAKSTPEAPKWSVVHLEFRQRFPGIISLKELNSYKQPGGVLAGMQVLKQSRLSVSKVTKQEWDFILTLAEEEEEEEEEAGAEK